MKTLEVEMFDQNIYQNCIFGRSKSQKMFHPEDNIKNIVISSGNVLSNLLHN